MEFFPFGVFVVGVLLYVFSRLTEMRCYDVTGAELVKALRLAHKQGRFEERDRRY